jgi:hypothetical protein
VTDNTLKGIGAIPERFSLFGNAVGQDNETPHLGASRMTGKKVFFLYVVTTLQKKS